MNLLIFVRMTFFDQNPTKYQIFAFIMLFFYDIFRVISDNSKKYISYKNKVIFQFYLSIYLYRSNLNISLK